MQSRGRWQDRPRVKLRKAGKIGGQHFGRQMRLWGDVVRQNNIRVEG